MARSISSSLNSALTDKVVKPILLVEAQLDEGTVYLWNGIGNLVWQSATWTGAGAIMNVGTVEEQVGLKATGTNIQLNGIPAEYISMALQADYQGRKIIMRVGALDGNNDIIADPVVVFSGRIDVMNVTESGDISVVGITIENRLIDFERPRVRRYTDQDLKIDYPDDLGLQHVAAIQNKDLVWGQR